MNLTAADCTWGWKRPLPTLEIFIQTLKDDFAWHPFGPRHMNISGKLERCHLFLHFFLVIPRFGAFTDMLFTSQKRLRNLGNDVFPIFRREYFLDNGCAGVRINFWRWADTYKLAKQEYLILMEKEPSSLFKWRRMVCQHDCLAVALKIGLVDGCIERRQTFSVSIGNLRGTLFIHGDKSSVSHGISFKIELSVIG
jgi:hypothetical protein